MRRVACMFSLMIVLIISSTAFASNGMLLEGYGPVSHAMGGASIAFDNGTAAMVNNPATLSLMDSEQRFDLALGILRPNVKWHMGSSTYTSQSKSFFMPGLGYARKNGALTYGLGIYSHGGMGTDFLDGPNMYSQFIVGRIMIPVSYAVNEKLTIGASFQYIRAEMDLVMGPFNFKNGSDFSGATSATGFSALLGMTYLLNDQTRVGVAYQHKANLGDLTGKGARVQGMDMPASLGIGVARKLSDKTLLALEYRRVFWSNVLETVSITQNGVTMAMPQYWDDQDIFSLGVSHQFSDRLTLRLGASFANNPVDEYATPLFPAITKDHYSMGIGYRFDEKHSVDASFSYVPRVSVSNTLDFAGSTTSHSQRNFQLMYSYRF